MPSVAESSPCVPTPGKKRRRDHDEQVSQNYPQSHQQQEDGGSSYHLPGQSHFSFEKLPLTAFEHVNRKIMPLPPTKRQRCFDEEENHNIHDVYAYPAHGSPRARKPQHVRSPSHYANTTRPLPPSRVNTSAVLGPCHVCHRKPTKKSDLDSFAECQGCWAQTCFVCLRKCQGWVSGKLQQLQQQEKGQRHRHHGDIGAQTMSEDGDGDLDLDAQEALSRSFHMEDADNDPAATGEKWDAGRNRTWVGGHRSVVCSQCCVEQGTEGDVVCLGCFSHVRWR